MDASSVYDRAFEKDRRSPLSNARGGRFPRSAFVAARILVIVLPATLAGFPSSVALVVHNHGLMWWDRSSLLLLHEWESLLRAPP